MRVFEGEPVAKDFRWIQRGEFKKCVCKVEYHQLGKQPRECMQKAHVYVDKIPMCSKHAGMKALENIMLQSGASVHS